MAIALFGPTHLAILAAVAALCVALPLRARAAGDARGERLARGWAALLMANKVAVLWLAWRSGLLDASRALPMHLCDWASICAVVALLIRRLRQSCGELAYFWGLSGTLQALVTPDLGLDCPAPQTFTFFISHGGLVVASVLLAGGLGVRIDGGGVWRAFGWTQVYVAAALAVNAVAHANYGYLCAKPASVSLLDHLAGWPWYIAQMEAVALASFVAWRWAAALVARIVCLQGAVRRVRRVGGSA